MNNDNLQDLVDGWLAYHRAAKTDELGVVAMPKSDELFQFVIDVDDIVRGDSEQGWFVIQLIFAACRNDFERACLAAGPLEDLLSKHGSAVIDTVELTASKNSEFRELLAGVWRNGMAQQVWERIQRIAGMV